jgi:hypothetical protein
LNSVSSCEDVKTGFAIVFLNNIENIFLSSFRAAVSVKVIDLNLFIRNSVMIVAMLTTFRRKTKYPQRPEKKLFGKGQGLTDLKNYACISLAKPFIPRKQNFKEGYFGFRLTCG